MTQQTAAAANIPCVNRWCVGLTAAYGQPCPIHKTYKQYRPAAKGRLSRVEREQLLKVAFSK